jgi:hypothetical protein
LFLVIRFCTIFYYPPYNAHIAVFFGVVVSCCIFVVCIPLKSATHSRPKRPPIPRESGRLFQAKAAGQSMKPATYSMGIRPPLVEGWRRGCVMVIRPIVVESSFFFSWNLLSG